MLEGGYWYWYLVLYDTGTILGEVSKRLEGRALQCCSIRYKYLKCVLEDSFIRTSTTGTTVLGQVGCTRLLLQRSTPRTQTGDMHTEFGRSSSLRSCETFQPTCSFVELPRQRLQQLSIAIFHDKACITETPTKCKG